MTRDEINRKLDEASIGHIVLHDDRGGSGNWMELRVELTPQVIRKLQEELDRIRED